MVLFLLACTPEPSATAPPPAPDHAWVSPEERGGWPVGVRTEQVSDPRGGVLTVEIFYPSAGDGPPVDYGLPYMLDTAATRDSTPAGTGHPVVAFSHGHGGSRVQSVYLTEQLASHGFVVLAVDHPFDTLFDFDAEQTPSVAARRPDDVRFTLDHLLSPDHDLAPHLDSERIGMMGHSFGAWTAMVLGGGLLDVEAGLAWCEQESPAGCDIVGDIALEGPPPSPDPRITTTVLLAPGGWYSFSDLSGVTPVLQISGSEDGDLPMDEEQQPTFDRLGSPATRMLLDRGGHFGFTDGCALVPLADCAGESDGYMDPLRMQVLSSTAVTAFLGVELRDEPRYAPWLEADAWGPDVTWTRR